MAQCAECIMEILYGRGAGELGVSLNIIIFASKKRK